MNPRRPTPAVAIANTPNVDTHVAFVNNGTNTNLWVNGALVGSFDGTPTLSGMIGIGQVYNPGGTNFDLLTGTIIGVAVYDAALDGAEIAAHARAYAIPEPASLMVALGATGCVPLCRRWLK